MAFVYSGRYISGGSMYSIIEHPFDNGMTVFVSGFLFTLSIYHIMLFFQHRDFAYLLYSFYMGLIFAYISMLGNHFFIEMYFHSHKAEYYLYSPAMQWLFNTVYFIFVINYIELWKERPGYYGFLKVAIISYMVIWAGLVIYTGWTGNNRLFLDSYAFFFLPTVSVLAVLTMWVLFRMENSLKHYILIGSGVYLVLSLVAFYEAYYGHSAIYLFYLAVMAESIFFALGLGMKRRRLLEEKHRMQELAIAGHRQNIELQKAIQKKMDEEIRKKVQEIETLIKEKKEKERKILEAEHTRNTLELRLRALQTQMNPHFLFNALNSIKHFIISDKKEDASLYLGKLSNLIRKILDNSKVREIYLKEELNIMKLYVEVENLRLANPIQLDIHIQGNITGIKLPPLILQPFIENAIWHGLALKKSDKRILIEIKEQKGYLIIQIEDNGIGREKAALIKAAKRSDKKSLGIALTIERLKAFFDKTPGEPTVRYEDLYDSNHRPSGTRVILEIPVFQTQQDE